MHVVMTHVSFPLYWQPRLRSLAERLQGRGNRLTVLEVARGGGMYSFAGEGNCLPSHVLFEGAAIEELRSPAICRAVFAKLDSLAPDVVVAGPIAFPPGVTAVRWCRSRGRGVIVCDDARHCDVTRSPIVNAVKRRIYANVDAVLVSAASHRDDYVRWGIPASCIFFGLSVVDNGWFASRAQRARENGLDAAVSLDRRPYFLGAGRQNANKNWLCALRAYATYRSRVASPWDLVLLGEGPTRASLEQYVAEVRLAGVRFVGFQSQEELCRYYAFAGAFVLPSFRETWGNMVNEAMACGVPVLVSKNAGCVETLVREGATGWKFDPASPGQLAEQMVRVASLSDAELETMRAAARETIEEWPLDRFTEGMLAAIDVANNSRRGFCSLVDRCILRLWKGRYRPV